MRLPHGRAENPNSGYTSRAMGVVLKRFADGEFTNTANLLVMRDKDGHPLGFANGSHYIDCMLNVYRRYYGKIRFPLAVLPGHHCC
jgi:hypothetical protein